MDLDFRKLGKRLRELREQNEFTQSEVAARLGVSKQLVSHWELGRSELTIPHLINLARELRVDVNQVLFGANYRPVGNRNIVPLLTEEQIVSAKTKAKADIKFQRMTYTHSSCSPEAVAFFVFDRSLCPTFRVGDLVVVDPTVRPQPGDCIAVVLRRDQRLLFRRYKPSQESRELVPPFVLRADHVDYEPRSVSEAEEPCLVGCLVEHTRFSSTG